MSSFGPEGPLARGSDRRASITVQPGGSAANQAAWLASFGVGVDFVARVGAADLESETARFKAIGVTPHLVGDPGHETGRLIALIDADGERSFLTDRGANEALEARDIPDALIASASHINLSGYSFFAPSPRAAVLDVMRRAGEKSVSIDPASAEFLREVGADNFLAWTQGATILFPNEEEAAILAGSDDPETQCARLASRYPLVIIKRGAAGAEAAEGARRWRVNAPKSRQSTPPARVTPLLPAFSLRGLRAQTFRPRSGAPQRPALPLRRSPAEGRRRQEPRGARLTDSFSCRQIGLSVLPAEVTDFTLNPATEKIDRRLRRFSGRTRL